MNYDLFGRSFLIDPFWIRDILNSNHKYPPYNIGVKVPDERGANPQYFIEVAVAGLKLEDIRVAIENRSGVDFLLIYTVNYPHDHDKTIKYSHKGIATREFSLTFELGRHTKVEDVTLNDGILKVMMSAIKSVAGDGSINILEIKKGAN